MSGKYLLRRKLICLHSHGAQVVALLVVVRVPHVALRVARVVEEPQGDGRSGHSDLQDVPRTPSTFCTAPAALAENQHLPRQTAAFSQVICSLRPEVAFTGEAKRRVILPAGQIQTSRFLLPVGARSIFATLVMCK